MNERIVAIKHAILLFCAIVLEQKVLVHFGVEEDGAVRLQQLIGSRVTT